jgi:dTDP-4-dehydrorhamnose 3,5-epimerase
VSSRIRLLPTPIQGLAVVERLAMEDHRGELERLYCREALSPAFGDAAIAQANRTLTRRKGTIRGLHYQRPPHGEDKLVSCLRGEVFDVAVDLRPGSATFLRWHGEVLAPGNRRSLAIPRGFAHGFQALTDDCELLYLHSSPFLAAAEAGIDALDPALAIAWPLAVTDRSDRDRTLPATGAGFAGIKS